MRYKPELSEEQSAEPGNPFWDAYFQMQVERVAGHGLDTVSRFLEELRMMIDEAEAAHNRGDAAAFKQTMKQVCQRLSDLAR